MNTPARIAVFYGTSTCRPRARFWPRNGALGGARRRIRGPKANAWLVSRRAAHHAVLEEHPVRRRAIRAAVLRAPTPVGAKGPALRRHGIELDAVVVDLAVRKRRGEIGPAFVASDHRPVLADDHAIAACAREGRRVKPPVLVILLRDSAAREQHRNANNESPHGAGSVSHVQSMKLLLDAA